MTLIVEDGSGLENATSLVSIAELDAYHAAYGNTAWAPLNSTQKEIAALRGNQYVEIVYGGKLLGYKVNFKQALSWPRTGVQNYEGISVDILPIPVKVKQAYMEAIYSAAVDGELFSSPASGETGIKLERIKVGPIEVEEQYASSKSTAKTYPKVLNFLAEYISTQDRLDRA